MIRKPTIPELEQRLRLEAECDASLSRAFRAGLRQRLVSAAPAAHPVSRRALWSGGLIAAAALVAVVAVTAVLAPRPAPRSGQAEVAAALGAVVHSALVRPEAIASAGEQRLTEEARRLLADARQATSPLLSPWRRR